MDLSVSQPFKVPSSQEWENYAANMMDKGVREKDRNYIFLVFWSRS